MSYIWSPEKKFSTWRRLWVALAKAEKELGECAVAMMTWNQIKRQTDRLAGCSIHPSIHVYAVSYTHLRAHET